MKAQGVPLILLGGGGYTIKNVARLWAYETAVAVDEKIPRRIPDSDLYLDHYAPTYAIDDDGSEDRFHNENTPGYINHIKSIVLEQYALNYKLTLDYNT